MKYQNGSYSIQEIPVLSLVERFGSPLYVYDGEKIISQIATLYEAFDGLDVKIKYACKANTALAVLQLMRQNGVELDVVSPQELRLGMLAGYEPSQVNFTPSGVNFAEIAEAADLGAFVNLDNLDVLETFGKHYGGSKPCMIRIKPNVAAGGNVKIMTAHEGSKFGIDIRQKDEILAIVERYGMNIVGLHQHTGSDIKEASAFLEAAAKIFELAYSFPNLHYIDLGGGFKVAYREGDPTTDMLRFGKELTVFFNDFCAKYGRKVQLWFEPGKFLVSECGYLFVEANAVKQAPGRTFVGVNSGLNHLIRPMMYDAYHHIVNVSNPDAPLHPYDVVGYICETDTFATQRNLPEVRQGDTLALLNAGAYGMSMASNYNSRFRPAEVLVVKGEAHLIRERESFDDLIKNQKMLPE